MGACLTRSQPVAPSSPARTANVATSDDRSAPAAPPVDLTEAVRLGNVSAASRFIEQNPAAASEVGLLHIAAESGSAEVVTALLEAGADPHLVDSDGQTPLHIAVANDYIEAAERLTAMQPCVELQVTDNYKMSPLHLASEVGDPQMIALLLARGATQTPNSPTRPPRTWHADGSAREEAAPAPDDDDVAALADDVPSTPSKTDADAASSHMPPASPGSPLSARRKQMLQMQKEKGGSALYIARQHQHMAAVELLERAASGEEIPMPVLTRDPSVQPS